ncbi:unnamed protein product (mitochondrion) [Plasmodiophora brassicae]|uniref:Protein kinase domain-containing protein n=1 Tax=Plasmodiophora brassicae TaxID=37360 RepID=A0A3P3YJB2_PLABS|nr:unnamed protein product [Plasmodiophora brassicae]
MSRIDSILEAKRAELGRLHDELHGEISASAPDPKRLNEIHTRIISVESEIDTFSAAKAEAEAAILAANAEAEIRAAETQTAKAETRTAKAEILIAKAQTRTAEVRAEKAEQDLKRARPVLTLSLAYLGTKTLDDLKSFHAFHELEPKPTGIPTPVTLEADTDEKQLNLAVTVIMESIFAGSPLVFVNSEEYPWLPQEYVCPCRRHVNLSRQLTSARLFVRHREILRIDHASWATLGCMDLLKDSLTLPQYVPPWVALLDAAVKQFGYSVKPGSFLGAGATGRVFRVERPDNGSAVALKVVKKRDAAFLHHECVHLMAAAESPISDGNRADVITLSKSILGVIPHAELSCEEEVERLHYQFTEESYKAIARLLFEMLDDT